MGDVVSLAAHREKRELMLFLRLVAVAVAARRENPDAFDLPPHWPTSPPDTAPHPRRS
jgi:hypothetical protein